MNKLIYYAKFYMVYFALICFKLDCPSIYRKGIYWSGNQNQFGL